MAFLWKRKSIAPSTESSQAILDAPLNADEASSLNSHPVLTANSSTNSHQSHLVDMASAATTAPAADAPSNEKIETSSSSPNPSTPTSSKRRSFFGFGRKKTSDGTSADNSISSPPTITTTNTSAAPASLSPTSPNRSALSTSPPPRGGTNTVTSNSPRLSTSSIFERNVQDPSHLPPGSPAIPQHFQTENYIPPVLEATSLAITDKTIDPDRVEIVSSSSHHPALSNPEAYANPWAEETDKDSPGYGSSHGAADTRRLSFISFADVVQAENAEASHSSTNVAGTSSSPSPPMSSGGLTGGNSTTTAGLGGLMGGLGISSSIKETLADRLTDKESSSSQLQPPRSVPSGATSQGPHGELTVETMTQALRRHGSGDLGAAARTQQTADENPWKD